MSVSVFVCATRCSSASPLKPTHSPRDIIRTTPSPAEPAPTHSTRCRARSLLVLPWGGGMGGGCTGGEGEETSGGKGWKADRARSLLSCPGANCGMGDKQSSMAACHLWPTHTRVALPHAQGTHLHAQGTHPHAHGTHPHARGTHSNARGTHSNMRGTHLHAHGPIQARKRCGCSALDIIIEDSIVPGARCRATEVSQGNPSHGESRVVRKSTSNPKG